MSEDRFQELKEKVCLRAQCVEQRKTACRKDACGNNKLFIRAVAPSDEAKNKFWDAVKTANAT